MTSRTGLVAFVLSLVFACGGDESTAYEGIYELSSWTVSAPDCEAAGQPSFEEGQYSHFFVRDDKFFGEFMINVVVCDDLDQCRTDAADSDTLYIGQFYFDEGSDDQGWSGWSGFLGGDTCDGTIRVARLTGEAGVSVEIAEDSVSVTNVPRDAEGECDFDAAREQADGEPCESRTIVTGAYVEGV